MAKVPYSPVPDVAPSGQALPNFNPSGVSDEAFGAGVGKAMSRVGAALEGAGDELFKRALQLQTLANDAAAKEKDAEWIIRSSEMHAEYNAKTGIDAVRSRPDYIRRLDELRAEIRDTLPNDASRKIYDGTTRQSFARTVFASASHAAREQKAYNLGASTARIDAESERAQAFPLDDDAFEAGIEATKREVRYQANTQGVSPEAKSKLERDMESRMWSQRLTGMSRKDPFKAMELYEQNASKLTAKDRETVERIVVDGRREKRSQIISAEVNGENDFEIDKKPLQELIDEGLKRYRQFGGDDPYGEESVRNRITSDYYRRKKIDSDQDQIDFNTIEGFLGGSATGKPVTSLDEITSTPEGLNAWNRIKDEKRKRAYLGQMALNAKKELVVDSTNRFHQLQALAENEPEAFIATDLAAETLTRSDYDKLWKLKQEKIKSPEKSPLVTRAMGLLGPNLRAAGLDREKDKTEWDQFQGALQDQMVLYQTVNKKPMPHEEIEKTGARLLQQIKQPGWLWSSEQRFFSVPMPDKDKQAISDAWRSKYGTEPEPWQIQRLWTAKQYQLKFGGITKANAPAVPKPKTRSRAYE